MTLAFLKKWHLTLTSKFRCLHAQNLTVILVNWKSNSNVLPGLPCHLVMTVFIWGNFLEAASQSVVIRLWRNPWKCDVSCIVLHQQLSRTWNRSQVISDICEHPGVDVGGWWWVLNPPLPWATEQLFFLSIMNDSCPTLMVSVVCTAPLKCGDNILGAAVLWFSRHAPQPPRLYRTLPQLPSPQPERVGCPPQMAEGPHLCLEHYIFSKVQA